MGGGWWRGRLFSVFPHENSKFQTPLLCDLFSLTFCFLSPPNNPHSLSSISSLSSAALFDLPTSEVEARVFQYLPVDRVSAQSLTNQSTLHLEIAAASSGIH